MSETDPIRRPRLAWLGSARLTTYGLVILLVLTFWGTLYQVDHGLYAAKERFFDAWIVLIAGFLPFPGTQLVLAVLTINLIAYIGRMVLQRALPFGLFLTHVGLLMLLLGGAVTRALGREGQLTLKEGEARSAASAYGDWEIAAWWTNGPLREVVAYPANGLKSGDELRFEEAGLTVRVEAFHRNARAFQSSTPPADAPVNRMGITSLRPARLEKEPGENIAGAELIILPDGGNPVRAILFGEDETPVSFERDGRRYQVGLRRAREPLPFIVRLIDFRRELHPGTDIPRHFSSLVSIMAGGVERTVLISMNKPFRDRGYTLYQASYREEEDGSQWSTFAVTHNVGRLIPYYATAVIVAGLIWHFVAQLIARARRDGGVS